MGSMNFFLTAVFFVAGFFLMTFGADHLVRAGSAIAAYFRISPLIIGLTIVSFGTSFPEFAASFMGALHGRTDISLGNVVGSNICNLGLVLGAAAITRPIRVQSGLIRREIPFVLAVSILTWIMVSNGVIQRLEGLMLAALFCLFLWYCIAWAKREAGISDGMPAVAVMSAAQNTMRLVLGLGALFAGAELVIRSAVAMAERFQISEAVIGLTLVAFGTSLPELVTSVVAMKNGEGDIGLGNILGSNIFNLLFVLGVTAAVRPVTASPLFFRTDIPVMLALTVLLLPMARTQLRISRREGLFLLSSYGAYLLYLIIARPSTLG